MKTDYTCWGVSELIEKCEIAENFAKEIAEYLNGMQVLTEQEEYLLEQAKKLLK